MVRIFLSNSFDDARALPRDRLDLLLELLRADLRGRLAFDDEDHFSISSEDVDLLALIGSGAVLQLERSISIEVCELQTRHRSPDPILEGHVMRLFLAQPGFGLKLLINDPAVSFVLA